jgi:hypothetical protein
MTRSQINYDANQMMVEAHANADFALNRVSELLRGAGAAPANASIYNALAFLTNPATNQYRILSDYDGDGLLDSRLSTTTSNPDYYAMGSEDVTLRFFPATTTVGQVTIPANSLTMIDNTPGTGQGVPVVIASNIIAFNISWSGSTPTMATVTLTGGPSRQISPTDPRYRSFTRTTQIRLRNR